MTDTEDWRRRALTAEAHLTRARALAEHWATYAPTTYGPDDAQRVKFAQAAFTDASTQLTAALNEDPWTGNPPPQVPDLPCRKCGSPDVAIEYCSGDWGSIAPENRDTGHFHRTCGRCSHRWRTDDALDTAESERTAP
jgi:hypothetical protein